ncbi:unnamed protein product [Taenia asiatica]|uniref:Serine/arginine repetitive matrix protein 1-like n=1 Tax=Taenia asiatica TaxID=60517 RepID=A0A0R3W7W8_TAEAS|nr:unnamed protein product [Taenia asiatica]
MVDVRANVTRELEHDEGELNSEEESRESSSEGFTTDGEEDSNEDDQSDKHQSSTEETPWERGLRLARERAKKAKLLRQSDVDLEDKKLNFTVVAPDPNEDDAYADVCDIGRSGLSDTFWVNYHKLAIIGSTQLTCKRSLPCDLSPPSQRTMARWRRRLSDARARSSDVSAASPSSSSSSTVSSSVTSNYGSRDSSLSSLAGSILLAVPDLVLADDSDREEQRRRRHRSSGGRRRSSSRGSSSSSSESSSGSGSRSGHCASSSRSTSRSSSKANQKNQQRKEGRGVYSASSSSSSPSPAPTAPNAFLRNRSRLSGKDEGPIASPRLRDEDRTLKSRRPQVVSYGDQCHPPAPAAPQVGGYHHQQSNFSRSAFRDTENGSNYSNRHSYGDSSRWYESSNRSPDRPPPMPSERPVKRPWVAEPPKSRVRLLNCPKGSQIRQRSPPPQPMHRRSRSRRSRSRSRSASRGGSSRDDGTGLATYITSWSQSRGRQHVSKPTLPDDVPLQTVSSPPRKRPASSRRKSRSPFADSYFGNPPAPAEVPFEQSVPLLAGAVNPAAPPPNATAATKALPSASARPGVKLKIAPRVRSGLVLPESALERAHRDNDYKVGGSPVSSASSGGGGGVGGRGGRSGSLSPGRRDKSSLASLSAAKRMRHLGYTAVSPGGFESPPPPPITSPPSSAAPARSYSRSRRLEADEAASRARNRAPDQGMIFRLHISIFLGRFDGHRSRTGGDCHDRADRFSRSGQLHAPTERYRDRRPPPPERFDRRIADRRIPSYDRGRSGREYFGDSRYGRSRGEERDASRSYGSGRHGGTSRRQGNAGRSRSPFEGRSSGGGGHFHSDTATEQRLNELRRRLIMVDDKIAELGGAPVSERR